MLQLKCPYCGTRDEVEFSFGGESNAARPEVSASDREWAGYLFNRTNAKGIQRECWFHQFGCGQWFEVDRDTLTHEIKAVAKIAASAPATSE